MKGFPDSKQYETLTRTTDKFVSSIESKILNALKEYQNSADIPEIENAISYHSISRAMDALDPHSMILKLQKLVPIYEEGMIYSGKAQAATLNRPKPIKTGFLANLAKDEFTFNPKLKVIQDKAADRVGKLADSLNEESKKALANYLSRGILENVPTRDVAKNIKSIIGLNDRQANAVFNFKKNLESQDTSAMTPRQRSIRGDNIESIVDKYSERLLKDRAETIARTEITYLASAGQMELWNQASSDGLFDREIAMKEWIVTPDDKLCPICEPLSGLQVGLDSDFPEGVPYPPLHPNCRCAVNLII